MQRHSTAILTLTHIWSRGIAREHRKRERECASMADVYVLYHQHRQPPPVQTNLIVLDDDWLSRQKHVHRGLPQSAAGHLHLLLFEFARQHPDYKMYWVIEYDMRCRGSWGTFFARMAEVQADYYTTHVGGHQQQPEWIWWNSLSHPSERIAQQNQLRSLNTIYGLSRRALVCLEASYASGWYGHNEVLFPTLLHQAGLTIVDVGGNGDFTPAAWKGKQYTAGPARRQGLHRKSTVRVRPARLFAGHKGDHLYHPVKPIWLWIKSWHKHVAALCSTLSRRIRKGAPHANT